MKRGKPIERKTPLKSKQEHDWVPRIVGGIRHWVCARCNSLWIAGEPPIAGCNGLRRVPLNPVNSERKQRMRTDQETGEQHTYGPYHRWIEKQPCIVTYTTTNTVGHHLTRVKSGGRDYANEIPLDYILHVELHDIGEARFCAKYDLPPLRYAAERLAIVYDRREDRQAAVDGE
jgi:hypothetical protein